VVRTEVIFGRVCTALLDKPAVAPFFNGLLGEHVSNVRWHDGIVPHFGPRCGRRASERIYTVCAVGLVYADWRKPIQVRYPL